MSMGVLLQAVRDRLIAALSIDDPAKIAINGTGRPDPLAGEEFWVVHPGAFNNTSVQSLDERYDVCVTVSRRTEYAPDDRSEDWLVTGTIGLYDRIALARAAVHMNYQVLADAGGFNGQANWAGGKPYSLPNTVNGFAEPLMFSLAHLPVPQGPEWFGSNSDGDEGNLYGGVSVQLDFLGARRTQNIASQA